MAQPTLILSGTEVAKAVKSAIQEQVKEWQKLTGSAPQLAVINIGDDPASHIYLRNKEKACQEVGITSLRFKLEKEQSQEELDSLITKLNADKDVNGILVQLPMPTHFSVNRVLEAISPQKDADGFCPENLGLLLAGRPRVKPCTPFGIMKILEHYNIPLKGKNIVVVGRSTIVGKPMAQLALEADATVTVCHSKTKDLKSFTKAADIVICAIGKPQFFDKTYFNEKAVVVDVGIHHVNGKTVGDVNFQSCQNEVAALTPVPGGVGPMTVAMLLQNTMTLARMQGQERKL